MSDLNLAELKPRIVVVGVGGAGGNAVNNMIDSRLEGAEFLVCNTDAQALGHASTDNRIQLGATLTKGLGAGARPEVGRAAAEESIDTIIEKIKGANMVFITAGMGGGTGTGAAPIIAKSCREHGILTVGVVTKPFTFEGNKRAQFADQGIEELKNNVDTLIIIPNQNLFRIATENTSFADAFKMADDVLYQGVRGVTDLMVKPGLVNLDFNDISTVMSEMGKAMMGTGESQGDDRAIKAAESAISNPLLDDVTMKGARGVLVNITGSGSMTMFEVDEAANRIRAEIDDEAEFIFGCTFDESLGENIRVSVVATGIEDAARGVGSLPSFARAVSGTTTVKQVSPADVPNHPAVRQPTATPTANDRAVASGTADNVTADDILNILDGTQSAPADPAPQAPKPVFQSLSTNTPTTPRETNQAETTPLAGMTQQADTVATTESATQETQQENGVSIGETYALNTNTQGTLAVDTNTDDTDTEQSKSGLWGSIRKFMTPPTDTAGDDNQQNTVVEMTEKSAPTTTQSGTATPAPTTQDSTPTQTEMPVFQSTVATATEPSTVVAQHNDGVLSTTTPTPNTQDDNGDTLEIPAFLRKQAN